MCPAELGWSWKGGLQVKLTPKHPWTVVVKTGLSAVHKGEISWSFWFMGPRGQTTSLQLDQLKTGMEEDTAWWNSQALCSATALWQQGLHIKPHLGQLNWTVQNLLCSNHSRQQSSLAGPETGSYPAQLVRESAAHPRADYSHRAEWGW